MPDRRPRRLSRPAHRAVLLVHVASAGSWLGLDLVLGTAVLTLLSGPPTEATAAALVLARLVGPPLLTVAVTTLASGLVLGLGTPWGLVRHGWVLAKLVITVVLLVLVVVLLLPALGELSAAAAASLDSGAAPPAVGQLVFPPVVSTTAVLGAMALSVFKPSRRSRARVRG
ncbi:hypothetical protein GC722_11835 [Auraticoccus sp. F435]|uniref:DUF2269 domain-containing protein n=1 Tax=Auraticoccus cholistanensis TaxID=2656650 RepID=A0A6A9UVJ3_9ACTN|nr:hypothetical protein [Auraticoccus cholistanensis]MVA76708.1 hypothetical protein [Auraticoccus cholistanensis]